MYIYIYITYMLRTSEVCLAKHGGANAEGQQIIVTIGNSQKKIRFAKGGLEIRLGLSLAFCFDGGAPAQKQPRS